MSQSRTRFLLAAFVLSAVGVLTAQEPQYRSANDSVPIYATVVDREGRLVSDLTRDDFEVYDNGRKQALTNFENGTQPITVVVMLDRSGSVEPQFKLVADAAAEFVRNLTPRDKARIGSFSERIQIDPETFTSDQGELLTILRERLQPHGATPLWHAASTSMSALAGESGRRVVLIFTDGHDAPLSEHPKVSFEEVRARAEVEEIMVYGIGLVAECEPVGQSLFGGLSLNRMKKWFQGRGGPPRIPPGGGRIRLPMPPVPLPKPPGSGPGGPGRPRIIPESRIASDSGCRDQGPDPSLRALTAVGGGGYFELRQASDLASTFAHVANELHHQYLLAFTAPAKDGALHRLDVRVKRPDVTVRARRAYVAPSR